MAIAYDQFPLERLQQGHSRQVRHPYEAASSFTDGFVTGAAGLLTRADPGTRARMLRQLQGTVGNALVQRMLLGVATATATVPVQRCGPIPCDCPPEEKRTVAAQTVMQREMEEGPRDAGTPGGVPGGGTQQASPASAARFNANPCVTECEECCRFFCKGNPEGERMCKVKCRGPYR